jgi:hypothetical protein
LNQNLQAAEHPMSASSALKPGRTADGGTPGLHACPPHKALEGGPKALRPAGVVASPLLRRGGCREESIACVGHIS